MVFMYMVSQPSQQFFVAVGIFRGYFIYFVFKFFDFLINSFEKNFCTAMITFPFTAIIQWIDWQKIPEFTLLTIHSTYVCTHFCGIPTSFTQAIKAPSGFQIISSI